MESWYKIPGLKHYLASNRGRIKSLPRKIKRKNGIIVLHKGKILKPHQGKIGYLTVGINQLTTPIHILICAAFHGKKPFKNACVEHIDDNKLNNAPTNLKWSTQAKNMQSALKNGRLKLGENASWSKLKNADIIEIRRDVRSHNEIAKSFNISRSTVGEIKNRLIWKHV